MMRTARNPLFSQAHDFSCFITDGEGYIVSLADGQPIHTGGGGLAVRALLKAFEEDFHEGDAFLLSDPYVAGGNHLPDWVIARPVFHGRNLLGFCCNRAHQADIGGGAAGTYNSSATEIFHEGLRLPPIRLVTRGKTLKDIWSLLLLNSRTPNLMDGDLRAMLGSTRIGMEQVLVLVEEIGDSDAMDYFAGILDAGERHMRAEIASLPDGEYYGEDKTDNDCFTMGDHVIRVTVKIKGDGMIVDFTGTSPQMLGFKNSSIANTYSAVYVGVVSFLTPDLPSNEGTFRPVGFVTPEGTLVNPRPPAPTTMNTLVPGTQIIHAVWQALGRADPDRACAGWGKNSVPTMSGVRNDGNPYVMYHWAGAIGGGAVDGRDGFNANGALIALGALMLPDIELYEQSYPVHFIRQEFRMDGGGVGKFRGGTGIDYAVEVESPSVLSLRGEGLRTPSGFGVLGGETGKIGEMRIICKSGETIDPPQYGILKLEPMRLELKAAGGSGWGSPLERDPEAVLRDVKDEVVSLEVARRAYGVVIDDTGKHLDLAETEKLRAQLHAKRKGS
jgi:N-methylhydantoinase B